MKTFQLIGIETYKLTTKLPRDLATCSFSRLSDKVNKIEKLPNHKAENFI